LGKGQTLGGHKKHPTEHPANLIPVAKTAPLAREKIPVLLKKKKRRSKVK